MYAAVHLQVVMEEVTNGPHRRLLLITIHQEEGEAEGLDEAAHLAEEDASPIKLTISGFDRLVLKNKLIMTMEQL